MIFASELRPDWASPFAEIWTWQCETPSSSLGVCGYQIGSHGGGWVGRWRLAAAVSGQNLRFGLHPDRDIDRRGGFDLAVEAQLRVLEFTGVRSGVKVRSSFWGFGNLKMKSTKCFKGFLLE